MMFLFSYEVDVLEIALHEAHDIVDKIVIVESSMSHRGVSFITMIDMLMNWFPLE